MKKIALVLMIFVYSLSTSGIGLRQFYCCGKLKSTDITFVQRELKEKCSKSSMSGCCKTTFKSLKVKDSHVASAYTVNSPVKHFTGIQSFLPSFEMAALAHEPMYVANASHAPPFGYGVAIYTLYCTYRI